MTDTQRNPLSAAAVRSLLTTAARLRQQGDIRRARVLLRALVAQRPDDPRVWRALADVAESEEERLAALRRVVLLVRASGAPPPAGSSPSAAASPATPPPVTPSPPPVASAPSSDSLPSSPAAPSAAPSVQRAVATPPPPSVAASQSVPSAPVDQTPTVRPERTVPPFPRQYTWIGMSITGVALLIVAVLLANARFLATNVRPEPTPPLATLEPTGDVALAAPSPDVPPPSPIVAAETPVAPSPATVAPTGAPVTPIVPSPPASTLAPTLPPPPASTPAPALPPLPSSTLAPTLPPLPTSTPAPTLPPGTVILRDVWTLTLLRPDHAVVLNGPIGSRQPNGRFILALVAVGNGGATEAVAPETLFALVDHRGNRYLPEPALSTLYLETFGRGVYGDFSLDEAIPAGVGQVSVPVIFEVPVDARGLSLHLGDSVAGWPVQGLP